MIFATRRREKGAHSYNDFALSLETWLSQDLDQFTQSQANKRSANTVVPSSAPQASFDWATPALTSGCPMRLRQLRALFAAHSSDLRVGSKGSTGPTIWPSVMRLKSGDLMRGR